TPLSGSASNLAGSLLEPADSLSDHPQAGRLLSAPETPLAELSVGRQSPACSASGQAHPQKRTKWQRKFILSKSSVPAPCRRPLAFWRPPMIFGRETRSGIDAHSAHQ